MKSPNNREDSSATGHHLSPNEASSIGFVLHLIELLAKGAEGNSKITQAVAKTVGFSPQTDSKFLLLKRTLTKDIKHGVIEPFPI